MGGGSDLEFLQNWLYIYIIRFLFRFASFGVTDWAEFLILGKSWSCASRASYQLIKDYVVTSGAGNQFGK